MEEISSTEVIGEMKQRPQSCFVRVVALGGGTGLANLLRGLKPHVAVPNRPFGDSGVFISELSAVVAVSDDGGSSGRLRREFNVLPPGDIRNCIAALCEDEALLSPLLQHRFHTESALNGHTFGNLFLTALTAITGDFAEAVKLSSTILNTRGHIYPATTSNVHLEALLADGTRISGETNINGALRPVVTINLHPPDVSPLPQTLEAISTADLITIGPGSLFTSLVPNLLVTGIAEAMAASHATKVFVCNLMTEANESLGLTAADHIRILIKHARIGIIDYALVNKAPISRDLKAKYAGQGGTQILVDIEAIEALGVEVILGEYLEEAEGVARHAAQAVAHDLLNLAVQTLQSKGSVMYAS